MTVVGHERRCPTTKLQHSAYQIELRAVSPTVSRIQQVIG